MVVIWNTSQVMKGGQVSVTSKAHTDVDIERIKIASFDDTRFVYLSLYDTSVLTSVFLMISCACI